MDTSIEDEAAKHFAGQFYNAIGFGLSVAKAFEQAKAHVEMELHGKGLDTGDPQLYAADRTDPSMLFLVRPPEDRRSAGS